jgi:hypothetical protein
VKSTRVKEDDTGILRINFPGYSGTGQRRVAQLHHSGKKLVALNFQLWILRKRLRRGATDWEVSQTSRE